MKNADEIYLALLELSEQERLRVIERVLHGFAEQRSPSTLSAVVASEADTTALFVDWASSDRQGPLDDGDDEW